jgi:hypothetical protein
MSSTAQDVARLPDWQLRLAHLVEIRRDQPFVWGERDCATWAADVVQAVTGCDPAADVRQTYGTALQALALSQRMQGLTRVCRERLGPRVRTALAQPGDIGLAREGGLPMLVACVGAAWMGQGTHGLVVVRPEEVRVAWRCC